MKETCASPPSNPIVDSLFQKTVIPRGEPKWITIDANPSPRSGLPAKVSKMVTKMVRHYDQDEREEDGSYRWETVRSVLLRELAQESAKYFSDNYWIPLIQQGSSKRRIDYYLDKKSLCYLRAIQGHSGGIAIRPGMMEYTLIPHNWKEDILDRRISWTSSGRKRG